jgi:hypothetical protein
MVQRLIPTGECWCGCGQETGIGSFFKAGHDKVAESAVVMTQFGGVPEFLQTFGFGPGARNARAEFETWKAKGGRPR